MRPSRKRIATIFSSWNEDLQTHVFETDDGFRWGTGSPGDEAIRDLRLELAAVVTDIALRQRDYLWQRVEALEKELGR